MYKQTKNHTNEMRHNIKYILCYIAGVLFFGISFLHAQDKATIKVDLQVFDFGDIEEANGPASHVFTVENQGNGPLVITRVTASCGCTRPEWTSEPIAAGKSTPIKVTYNPAGRPGPFYKTITIYSNAEGGRYNMAIKGSVIPKPKTPVIVYPYAIGNLKLHTKNILFNNLRQNEALGEKISIKNEGKASMEIQLGKLPNYLTAEIRPAKLAPNETGEITFLMNGHEIKNKGRLSLTVPVEVKEIGAKVVEEELSIAANVIDDFSKMSAKEKAKAASIYISGSQLDFGQISSSKSKNPFATSKLTGTVDITNQGKSDLIIHSFTTDNEDISISRGKKTIKPGETTTYKVSIRPKDVKVRLEALVNIISNDPNSPVRLLKVTAHK